MRFVSGGAGQQGNEAVGALELKTPDARPVINNVRSAAYCRCCTDLNRQHRKGTGDSSL